MDVRSLGFDPPPIVIEPTLHGLKLLALSGVVSAVSRARFRVQRVGDFLAIHESFQIRRKPRPHLARIGVGDEGEL